MPLTSVMWVFFLGLTRVSSLVGSRPDSLLPPALVTLESMGGSVVGAFLLSLPLTFPPSCIKELI